MSGGYIVSERTRSGWRWGRRRLRWWGQHECPRRAAAAHARYSQDCLGTGFSCAGWASAVSGCEGLWTITLLTTSIRYQRTGTKLCKMCHQPSNNFFPNPPSITLNFFSGIRYRLDTHEGKGTLLKFVQKWNVFFYIVNLVKSFIS